MNYDKIDAALASAIEEGADNDRHTVFIFADKEPSVEGIDVLKAAGVDIKDGKQSIFTAALSAEKIKDLSLQPWVKFIQLSQRSFPLSSD